MSFIVRIEEEVITPPVDGSSNTNLYTNFISNLNKSFLIHIFNSSVLLFLLIFKFIMLLLYYVICWI